jgi:hypothetical protein
VRRLALWLSLAFLVCASGRALASAPTTQPDPFIRCIDNGPQGGELDTAEVSLVNDSGVQVDLVAAVHIGELGYYQQIQADFAGYDAVLYELIKPRDSAPPDGEPTQEKSSNVITRFQQFLKNTLNLQYQLDVIDYRKPNFVHADLDKETFEQMEADRGESIWTILMAQMANQWSSPPPAAGDGSATPESTDQDAHDLIQFLCRPDGDRRLKMLIAKQMDQVEAATAGLNGPGGSVILTERDKAAMRALEQVMQDGKKKIAIFYGAAHMPDMEQRLETMGFRPTGTQWRKAWDMSYRMDQPSNAERALDALLGAFESEPGNQ